MTKKYCTLLLLFISIGLLFSIANMSYVSAQDENGLVSFKNVELWIYPEYDDPRLLVMLEGQIVGGEVPVQVRFLVPSAAEMYSAGSMDAQGQYSGGPPHREPSSLQGWDEISYEVTTNTFRVEYYDPIIRGQPDKTISYEFHWLYPISDVQVTIQEPRKSSNFSVLPEGESFIDDSGFTSHRYDYRELDDGSPLRFEIAYTKSDLKPSLAIEDTGSGNTLLTVSIVVGFIVVLGTGLLWVTKSKTRTRAERRRVSRSTPVSRSKGKRLPRSFCTHCGERLESPSGFCPYCGTKVQ